MSILRSEWRRFPRVIPQPEKPLAVQVEEPAGMTEVAVSDLSEGGLEILTRIGDPTWLGLPVRLRLTLPSGTVLPLRGRVRHVESNRVGIVFEELLGADRALIRQYVDRMVRETWWNRLRQMLQP